MADVSIPVEWLELPCSFADASQHQLARSRLATSERALDVQGFSVARVQRVLEGYSGAPPGADEVAERLHLSHRTLIRRLADCGTSFRALTGRHRRRRAQQLLSGGSLTVAEIGDRLCYADPANLGRAFRRWFALRRGNERGSYECVLLARAVAHHRRVARKSKAGDTSGVSVQSLHRDAGLRA